MLQCSGTKTIIAVFSFSNKAAGGLPKEKGLLSSCPRKSSSSLYGATPVINTSGDVNHPQSTAYFHILLLLIATTECIHATQYVTFPSFHLLPLPLMQEATSCLHLAITKDFLNRIRLSAPCSSNSYNDFHLQTINIRTFHTPPQILKMMTS